MPALVPDDDAFIRSLKAAGVRPPPPPRGPRSARSFREIGFERVFLTKIATQWIIGPIAGLIAFAVLYGNARYALRGLVDGEARVHGPITDLSDIAAAAGAHAVRAVRTLALPWAALLSFFVALTVAAQW